ncbi:MAG: K(+)-transporting ATPase subunit F [Acidipila sp.]|nr:K(+)-transporting ATPase subunit F [Acidipila sp.]
MYARHSVYFNHSRLFYRSDQLSLRMRPASIGSSAIMFGNVTMLVICGLVFGYLLYALLRPEDF